MPYSLLVPGGGGVRACRRRLAGQYLCGVPLGGGASQDVRSKLGDADGLPSVGAVRKELAVTFTGKLAWLSDDVRFRHEAAMAALEKRRQDLVTRQRLERRDLSQAHEGRRRNEIQTRAAQLLSGPKALWYRLTGNPALPRSSRGSAAASLRRRRARPAGAPRDRRWRASGPPSSSSPAFPGPRAPPGLCPGWRRGARHGRWLR